jgi:hypothetical protein
LTLLQGIARSDLQPVHINGRDERYWSETEEKPGCVELHRTPEKD